MNKKIATILSLVSLVVILLAIPLTTQLTQQRQEIRPQAAPATILSVMPSSSTIIINEVFNIDIKIDSGSNAIFGSDLEILFDPTVLAAQAIQPGGFLNDPQELIQNIDNQTGKIAYSLGSFSSKTGSGTLALVTFQAIGGGESEISFGLTTSVAAAGETEALASTQSGTVNVVEKVNLIFRIKFQGINQQRPGKTVDVQLKKAGALSLKITNLNVSSDVNGIYTGTINDIDPDTYDILIKGWVHLTKKFSGTSLNDINNSFDWSGIELLSGDATGDDIINIQDFRVLVEDYLQSEGPADFNLDGIVNIQDFRFIAENYLKEGEK